MPTFRITMVTGRQSVRLLWILSVFIAVVVVTGQGWKPGQCPGGELITNNTCEAQCAADKDCSGELICCYNGCGVADCMTPVDGLPANAVNRHEVMSCEGQNVNLQCSTGYHIQIMAAFWGRGDDRKCQNGKPSEIAAVCSMENVTTILRNECEDKPSCVIPAFTNYLGEPCTQVTHKYLKVDYQCKANMEARVMCEGEGLRTVICTNSQVIDVRDAFWGRDSFPGICPHESLNDTMDYCGQDNAYIIFKEMCNGRSKCDFEAVKSVWGEVCPEVHKYLYLTYVCADCVNEHYSDLDCDKWSLEGECGGPNHDWMSRNCRKSCEKCNDYVPAVVNYHDNDTECDIWAEIGECTYTQSFMLTYCRQSCMAPVTKTSCARNRHDDFINGRDCQRWADAGHCQTTNHYMFWDCTKSCFGCFDDDKVRCTNKYFNETACEIWADNGDCDTDPGWMIPNCFKSCMDCTADPVCKNEADDTDCDDWEQDGECESNATWMHKNCWKSCIKCDDAEDELTDCSVNKWDRDRDADNCDARADQGMCTYNSTTMLTDCTNSCFDCDIQADDHIKCENKVLDEDCEWWADNGECEANPGYMIPNCLKACILCDSDPVCDNIDADVDCEYWASIGECQANMLYMYQMCWSSCMKCDVDRKCVNTASDHDCDYWTKFGGCGSDNYMQPLVAQVCSATCTKCDPGLQRLPGCEDAFSVSDCPSWGSDNECSINPTWMFHYCRRSCTHCDATIETISKSSTTTTTTTSTTPSTTSTTPPTTTTSTTLSTTSTTPSTTTTITTTSKTTTITTPSTTTTSTTPSTTTTSTTPSTTTTSTTAPTTRTNTTPPTTRTNTTPPTTTTITTPSTSSTTPSTNITNTTSSITNTRNSTTITTLSTTSDNTTVSPEDQSMTDGQVITSGSDVKGSANWFSATNMLTRGKTFITPLVINTAGTLRSFTPRLIANTPVSLEIWRLDETMGFTINNYFVRVFHMTVQYNSSPSQPLTPDVTVTDCVEVREGDLIGFTSVTSPAPIDFKITSGPQTARTYFRSATDDQASFLSMIYTFDFGVAVGVEARASC